MIVEKGFDPAYQRVSVSVFLVANEFMGVCVISKKAKRGSPWAIPSTISTR